MADKNSVTVLKDGQLSVATVAQNGDIISEPSAISTTVLVQTEQGPQLAVPTVDLNGGGGGSVPTLTWFTGKTGQTLDTDIADLSTKPLVKVYKNGGLLQEGTTESGVCFVGGSYDKDIVVNSTAPLSTADSWEFQTKILWQGGGYHPTIICYSGNDDAEAPALVQEPNLGMYLSSNGSSWDISTPSSSSFTPVEGVIYEIKMGFTGTNYYLKAKAQGEADFTTYQSINSTAKVRCSVPFLFLNNKLSTSYYSASPICITETKIIINNEIWFDGSDASSFTNNGCTQTTFLSNDYAISGENVIFNTALIVTDKICVETY